MAAGRWMAKGARIAVAALALGAGVAQASSPAHWQAIARTDLDKVHELVRSTHPGWIDERNPDFRARAEDGYRQARAMLGQVEDYESAVSVVRFYTAGFRDGHFSYISRMRGQEPFLMTGWMLRNDATVSGTMGRWPVPLPPVGARLVQCDGLGPDALVGAHVAPFLDRRPFPALREAMAGGLANRLFPGHELKRCGFEAAGGERMRLDVPYGLASLEQVKRMPAWISPTPCAWCRAWSAWAAAPVPTRSTSPRPRPTCRVATACRSR